MNEIVDIKILKDYHVWIRFADGFEKVVNLRPFIGNGISEELLYEESFKRIFIEPGGGLAWYNGFDVCPNFLRKI